MLNSPKNDNDINIIYNEKTINNKDNSKNKTNINNNRNNSENKININYNDSDINNNINNIKKIFNKNANNNNLIEANIQLKDGGEIIEQLMYNRIVHTLNLKESI